MTKRFFSMLLALCMILSLLPYGASAAENSEVVFSLDYPKLNNQYSVNLPETETNAMEYGWGVEFTDGTNRFRVQTAHWKQSGSSATTMSLYDMQSNLWFWDGQTYNLVSNCDLSINGTVLTWKAIIPSKYNFDFSSIKVLKEQVVIKSKTVYDASYATTDFKEIKVGDLLLLGELNGMPIPWEVQTVKGDRALLLCNNTLGFAGYGPGSLYLGYENSTFDNWCQQFYGSDSFSDKERGMIATEIIENNYPVKLFVLSEEEYTKNVQNKKGRPLFTGLSGEIGGIDYDEVTSFTKVSEGESLPFWTRTGLDNHWIKLIDKNGHTGPVCFDVQTCHSQYGICPALYLDLSKMSGDDDPASPTSSPTPAVPTAQPPLETDNTFQYYATHLKYRDKLISTDKAKYTFHYDESWFEKSTTTYQHDLARMSLRMAMAGMARTDVNDATNHSNIEKLFRTLDFENPFFEYPPTETNSIGYAIGSKNIQGSDGQTYSLISVVIRSSGYFEEWGGNVTLGKSGNHKGFQTAAGKTVGGIENYIETNKGKLTDNIKIWITGYSRGAATANLAAAELNKEYGKENVYAYCFACPQGAVGKDAEGSKYNNIFSIVNPIDLVPKVAMSTWDFTRYGQTYYLPARSNSELYPVLKAKMVLKYIDFLSENNAKNMEIGVLSVTRELQSAEGLIEQGRVFDLLTAILAKNMPGGRAGYSKNLEDQFATAVSNLMGSAGGKLKNLNEDDKHAILLLLLSELGTQGGKDLLSTPIASLPIAAIRNEAVVGVEAATLALFTRYAHYPELCMAWLDALDGKTLCNILTGYRTIYVNCPVDVSVYDSNKTLVAKIVNDEPEIIENGISSYIDENGQKVLILPMDMQYTIIIQATDSGSMTYTAVDYDMDSGEYTQVVSYTDIPIKDGDQLRGTASKTDTETAKYTLKGNDGKTIPPSVKETGDEVQVWSVGVTAEEGGTVEGGGVFVVGEYAMVVAESDTGYRFLGWYKGETKVSAEAEYRFAVKKDVELTAKFEKTSSIKNPFKDVKKDAYYYEPVLWAVNHDPQITKGTSDTTFSPGDTCTRGQVVTFLWRAAGCPEPTSTKNPFKDVSKSDYFYKAVLWAVENGITKGTSATTFSPKDPCTRAHVVTFLYRSEGTPKVDAKNPFKDVKKDAYYYSAVLWAVKNEITLGTDATHFSPANPCTRGQIVTFLYRDMK